MPHELEGVRCRQVPVELSFSNGAGLHLEDYGTVVAKGKGFAKLEVEPHILKDPGFVEILSSSRVIDYKVAEPGLSAILSKFYAKLDKSRCKR